ncbi:MAG: hypothetical protein JXB49_23290 [Bacteroidales bacterium]|nr:hypothetical protein [Bacteroidales bacterium]
MSSQMIVRTSAFINNDRDCISGYEFINQSIGSIEPIFAVKIQEDILQGSIKISPLFSISKPTEKQAALFTNLNFTNNENCQKIIKEALKLSWEMGYKVAFTAEYREEYTKAGFQQVDRTFNGYKKQYPLLFFELSWDGIKKISNNIIFP